MEVVGIAHDGEETLVDRTRAARHGATRYHYAPSRWARRDERLAQMRWSIVPKLLF